MIKWQKTWDGPHVYGRPSISTWEGHVDEYVCYITHEPAGRIIGPGMHCVQEIWHLRVVRFFDGIREGGMIAAMDLNCRDLDECMAAAKSMVSRLKLL